MFKKITFIFPVLILVLFLSFLSLSNTLASSIDGYWEDNFDHGTSSIDTNRSKNIKLNPEKEQIEIYDYSGIATTVYENDFDYEGIILYENNFDYEGNPIPLPNGLANGDFENGDLDNWTTGGSNNIGWLATNEDKYNGSWSARSGDITWSNSSFIERDFTIANNQVPATLTFYWKSKGTDNDTLKLYDNGILQKKIEGNTHWTFVSYSIPDDSNNHTIKWECDKGSNNTTETKGFIDDVKLKGPGLINWQTGESNGVNWNININEHNAGFYSMQSGDITWSNSSFIERDFVGPGTLTFYWKSKGTDNDTLKLYDNGGTEVKTIEGDTDWKFVSHSINDNLNHTIKWKCYKGSNNITETKGFIDDVKFKEGPFSNEPPGSAWETGGSNGIGWSVTDEEKYGGLWSMQSGDITWSNSSFIKRDFTIANNEVPAILTFWWKSKGTDNDTLKLYDNGGTAVKTIKGDTDWKFVSYSIPDD
ncbi:MAG: hypothetical protein U9Q16_02130, partial [Patescibacteria group bacterium]|nr:hypothetical protein [Patescibacteria group bacterium]